MATATPTSAPSPKLNHIGLPVLEYRGGKSTLCAGCGHNAISERIIDAMYEMGVEPERVMKMSGIGCSSKSPAYFMSRSHSFTRACRWRTSTPRQGASGAEYSGWSEFPAGGIY